MIAIRRQTAEYSVLFQCAMCRPCIGPIISPKWDVKSQDRGDYYQLAEGCGAIFAQEMMGDVHMAKLLRRTELTCSVCPEELIHQQS